MKRIKISKRRWLFLPVETKARELTAKTLLACVAAERGWGAIIGQKRMVRGKQADFPRGTFIEKSITPGRILDIKKAHEIGNRISSWCEEGLNYLNREEYCQSRLEAESFAAIDYFFAWGKRQAEDIAASLGGEEKIILSGNPRFDLLRPELRNIFVKAANNIRNRYGNIILVNTKFSTINNNRQIRDFDYISFLRSLGKIKTKENEEVVRRFIQLNKRLFPFFMDMIPLLSEKFPNHTIIVRPHPSENHAPWIDRAKGLPNAKVIFEGNVNTWLMAADVMIHNNCTTGIESYLLGKPAISYRPFKDEAVEHQLPNQVSYQAFDEDGLIDLVSRLVENKNRVSPEERNKQDFFARKYIANIDGKLACETIMDYMEKVDLPICEGVFQLSNNMFQLMKKGVVNIKKSIKERFDAEYRKARLYNKQKFPGVMLVEMKDLLGQFQIASGRFNDIQITKVDDNTFCVFCPK